MQTTRLSLLQQLGDHRDAIAWEQFVNIYSPLVSRWVENLRVEKNSQNDVIQEVFLQLMNKIKDFRRDSPGSFRAWLRTITINKCRDYFRKRQRKSEPQFLEHLEEVAANESEYLTEKEYRDYVARAALDTMKKNFSQTTWRACWLSVAEGMPALEVAKELNITPNAVYLARGRVLQRLRKELDGLWD